VVLLLFWEKMIKFITNNWTALHVFILLIQIFFVIKAIRLYRFWHEFYEDTMKLAEASKELDELAWKRMDEANKKINYYNERIRQVDSLIESHRAFSESLEEKNIDTNKKL